MKKIISCIAMLVTVLCIGSATMASATEYKMKIAGLVFEPSVWYIATDYMEKRIEALSKGAIEVTQYKGHKLGGERQVLEGIKMGTIEASIMTTATFGLFFPEANIFALPYIFKDNDHMFNVVDGPYGKSFEKRFLKKTGVRITAWCAVPGLRGIYGNKPVRSLEDMKGLKVRVFESQSLLELYKAYGAIPVPMPFPEVYQALQQGVVDANEMVLDGAFASKQVEVVKYYTQLDELAVVTTIAVSEKWLNSLPEYLQKIVLQAAIEGAKLNREALRGELSKVEKEWIKRGKKLFKPDLEPFRKVAKTIYPTFYNQVGKENIEWILSLQKDVGKFRQFK